MGVGGSTCSVVLAVGKILTGLVMLQPMFEFEKIRKKLKNIKSMFK